MVGFHGRVAVLCDRRHSTTVAMNCRPLAGGFFGRNKCDPPASASGRRGLRPSRDTWRWRPRHRICQPHSRNQSIPAQRTTARAPSLRGQTTHDTLYQLSSTYYHLHLNTSTRPFFKSLNASILKCNRKSKIINLKFFASASREIWYNSPVFPQ